MTLIISEAYIVPYVQKYLDLASICSLSMSNKLLWEASATESSALLIPTLLPFVSLRFEGLEATPRYDLQTCFAVLCAHHSLSNSPSPGCKYQKYLRWAQKKDYSKKSPGSSLAFIPFLLSCLPPGYDPRTTGAFPAKAVEVVMHQLFVRPLFGGLDARQAGSESPLLLSTFSPPSFVSLANLLATSHGHSRQLCAEFEQIVCRGGDEFCLCGRREERSRQWQAWLQLCDLTSGDEARVKSVRLWA